MLDGCWVRLDSPRARYSGAIRGDLIESWCPTTEEPMAIERMRQAVILTTLIGCAHQLPPRSGVLAPAVDNALNGDTARLDCGASRIVLQGKVLAGCWGRRGDTAVFFYLDSVGQVVAVGREWLSSADALREHKEVAEHLSARLGTAVVCPGVGSRAWHSLERR